MPRVAEIRTIDGEVWVRIGSVPGEPGEITLWTPEEITSFKEHTVHNFLLDLYEQWKTRQ